MDQKKKALGRGLEQLFDSEVLDFNSFESNILESTDEEDIKEISLSDIRSNPYQPRKNFNDESLMNWLNQLKIMGCFNLLLLRRV